jgi:chromosome partitioning protein
VLASRIGQRVIFAVAARTGRLAGELEAVGLATREIIALTAEVGRLAR